jgi:hypothetical protein
VGRPLSTDRGAGRHVALDLDEEIIGNAQAQFLPHAIEWVWKGYPEKKVK